MRSREQELFHDALAQPAARRAAFLAAACGDDSALRNRVEALVQAAVAAGSFLPEDEPPEEFEGPGARIGAYRLDVQLGVGGFGVVYRAEQETPVRRSVALKILKLGMDTRAVVARFEAERQALALMDHPHIARVLDGGATAAGRPYFVMELVQGMPLTAFGREQWLTVRERLEVFLQICRAVQHAHHKGIIHRDLKPSNILVARQEGRLVAKVIDFGIAKATREPLTEGTLLTRLHLFVGTPDYMSPEQIGSGERDVDTRADLYSLGALLYEWLTDATPFDTRALMGNGFGAVEHAIRHEEPRAPSRRLAALTPAELARIAETRRTTPRRFLATLRGDLDWVVLKCLEKDRERRYQTADALARDVQRFLRNEPVQARPATLRYRTRKFVQRHRRGVFPLATLVVLLAGLGVYHTRRLARERDYAKLEAEKARKVSELLTGVLSAPDPFNGGNSAEPTVTSVWNDALEQARKEFAHEPALRAEILNAIGRVQLRRGRNAEAQALLEESLAASRAAGVADERLAQTLNDLGVLRRERGDFAEALVYLEESLAIRRTRAVQEPNGVAVSLVELGRTYLRVEDLAQAEPLFRSALAIRRQALGEHRETATSAGDLAALLWQKGDLADAEPLLEESLAMHRRTVGAVHPNVAQAMANLALLRAEQNNFGAAEQLLRNARTLAEKTLGADHWRTLRIEGQLAGVWRRQGRLEEAAELVDRARRVAHATLGDDHPLAATLGLERARVCLALGDATRAEPLLREALRVQLRTLPEGGWQVGSTRSLLGDALLRLDRPNEAEPLLTAASRVLKDVQGPQGWETAATRARLEALARRTRRAP